MFRQVELQRGHTQQVVWIPEQFAKRNKYLKIKDVDGWKVASVFGQSGTALLTNDGRDMRKDFASLN